MAVPVVICEFHQEVLPFIHRNIARKKLPFSNLNMVHFDSHPDLAFPRSLKAEDCFNKDLMYDKLEIADWIMPLAYTGHLSSVTWVKPPWAKQIRDLCELITVGEMKDSKKLG